MPTQPKDPGKKNARQSADQNDAIEYESIEIEQSSMTAGGSGPAADFAEIIRRIDLLGGIPISLRLTEQDAIDTGLLLSNFGRVTVAFPPCSAEMLALIRIKGNANKDDIDGYFEEYFKFGGKHPIISSSALGELDENLSKCSDPDVTVFSDKDPALTT